jgi:hypothetical protein
MSSAIANLPRPPQVYAFGQLLGCDRQPRLVSAWVRKQLQTIKETQSLEHGCIDADAHGVVPRFNAPKRRAAGEGAFGNDLGRQASTAPGIADIKPELAQGPPHANGRTMGCRHDGTFVFLYLGLM